MTDIQALIAASSLGAALKATEGQPVRLPWNGICEIGWGPCWDEALRRAAAPGGRGVAFEYREIISDMTNAPCVADLDFAFLAELDEARASLLSGPGVDVGRVASVVSGRPGGVPPAASRPPSGPPALQGGSSTPGRQRDRPGTH